MWTMLKNSCWSDMLYKEHPDAALDSFIDKHAPVKKLTVRTVKAPWIEELKN